MRALEVDWRGEGSDCSWPMLCSLWRFVFSFFTIFRCIYFILLLYLYIVTIYNITIKNIIIYNITVYIIYNITVYIMQSKEIVCVLRVRPSEKSQVRNKRSSKSWIINTFQKLLSSLRLDKCFKKRYGRAKFS